MVQHVNEDSIQGRLSPGNVDTMGFEVSYIGLGCDWVERVELVGEMLVLGVIELAVRNLAWGEGGD